jgi:hypothetical protein
MDSFVGEITAVCRHSSRRLARYAAQLPDDLVERLWNDPASLVTAGQPLQTRGVRSTVKLAWDGQPYVLKHYVEPSWRHALKRKVTPSRASLTWNVAHNLAAGGVATPRPVAYVENRWGHLRRDSFLIYPYVEGQTLTHFLGRQSRAAESTKDELRRQLCDLWERLLRLRASLADTNLDNFLVCPAGRLWVIDLDKARIHRLAYFAARRQRHAWERLLRSARKHGVQRHFVRADSAYGFAGDQDSTTRDNAELGGKQAKPPAAAGPPSTGIERRAAS